MKLPVIGITMGDPFGIGPEIIVKAFLAKFLVPTIVYGDPYIINKAAKLIGKKINIRLLNSKEAFSNNFIDDNSYLNIINSYEIKPNDFKPSIVSEIAGISSYNFIKNAVNDALSGKIQAIVTCPINKESFAKANINFPGHTELLAKLTNSKKFNMMMINDSLRIILVTIHIPLSHVSNNISILSELNSIKMAYHACQMLGIKKPRIAVSGLNPHAGENGKFGTEEIKFIIPAINKARSEGINVSGPLPGDTVFMQARAGKFDIVVAQYHDQGLIPIKYLGIDSGVNITLGLPIIRTSVDHGTAFDIAWKNGTANPDSLLTAINTAIDIFKHNIK
ncbi:MAG: 4-hydroxythreonine-4-phosphate dehydrogenase PdxA [Candidatus Kinetoplastibacterium crithidii]|nr:MAG: 4-hydroxythreonine-4-phosphate dehydrogenase PdxA [Candidatus Kinetoplastibacterium crithidii]